MNTKTKNYCNFLLLAVIACLISGLSANVMGQTSHNPDKNSTAKGSEAVSTTLKIIDGKLSDFTLIRDYDFGLGEGSTVHDSTELTGIFNSYGLAGTNVINNEWQRYRPINSKNHTILTNDLELRALTDLGGIKAGGISSGQITTKETFLPSSGKTYAFQVRAKIPKAKGAWPAFWMYAKDAAGATNSEIDIFEFFDSPNQNTFDWTGFDHGTGVGKDYYNIMTNQWVWHPGFDFASDYHTYTLIWKKGDIQKWVDDTMVKGTYFEWIGDAAPQIFINLAMGGSINSNPTLADTPFPVKFKIDYLKIYLKDETTSVTDIEAPSIPNALTISSVTQKSFTLSWVASSDNKGVTGYEVFRNGISMGITASTLFSVNGLSCDTAYSLTVRAKDAAGNWSDQSSSLNAQTLACNVSNIALNKKTSASGTEAASVSANLVNDGNVNTRWASLSTDPQWIEIDLGTVYTINSVLLKWEAAFGKSYKIQVSTNHTIWSDIYSTSSGDGGTDNITGLTASGRYIRMFGTVRNTIYGYSLFEFEVYGSTPTGAKTAIIPSSILTIYPNPTTGIVNIQMNKNINDKVQIEIYNIQGQKVSTSSYFAAKSAVISIDTDRFSKGLYIVKVIDKGGFKTATFTKE